MESKNSCCCFTGHRVIANVYYEKIRKRVDEVIAELYEKGVRTFITGGALGFDTLAAQAVLLARDTLCDIRLVLALPCKDQAKNWSRKNIVIYEDILHKADEVYYIAEEYSPACMLMRNRYMVDRSAYCIFYLTRTRGGTLYTVNYALENDVEVYNVLENG